MILLNDFIDESSIESRERLIDIEKALENLTEMERTILSLSLYGYSQQEIGERVGYDQSQICRILRNLHKKCLSFHSI